MWFLLLFATTFDTDKVYELTYWGVNCAIEDELDDDVLSSELLGTDGVWEHRCVLFKPDSSEFFRLVSEGYVKGQLIKPVGNTVSLLY